MSDRSIRFSTHLAVLSAAGAMLLASSRSDAACRRPLGDDARPGTAAYQTYENCRWDHRVGLEGSVAAGFGMALGPPSSSFQLPTVGIANEVPSGPETHGQRVGPGFGLNVSLGWRIVPAFSIGGHLAWQWSPATDLPTNTTFNNMTMTGTGIGASMTSTDFHPTGGHTDLWTAGLYARLYIGSLAGLRRVDPWIGVGFDFPAVGYVATNVHTVATTTNIQGTSTATNDGAITLTVASVNVPLTVGFDVNVTPELSLGLLAQVSLWVPYGRCANATAQTTVLCQWTWAWDETQTNGNVIHHPAAQFDTVAMFFTGLQGRFLAPW